MKQDKVLPGCENGCQRAVNQCTNGFPGLLHAGSERGQVVTSNGVDVCLGNQILQRSISWISTWWKGVGLSWLVYCKSCLALQQKPCHLCEFCCISWRMRWRSNRTIGFGRGLGYHFGMIHPSGWWWGPRTPKLKAKSGMIWGSMRPTDLGSDIRAKLVLDAWVPCWNVCWNLSRQCNAVSSNVWTNWEKVCLSLWAAWWYLGSSVCTWWNMWLKGVLKSPQTIIWWLWGNLQDNAAGESRIVAVWWGSVEPHVEWTMPVGIRSYSLAVWRGLIVPAAGVHGRDEQSKFGSYEWVQSAPWIGSMQTICRMHDVPMRIAPLVGHWSSWFLNSNDVVWVWSHQWIQEWYSRDLDIFHWKIRRCPGPLDTCGWMVDFTWVMGVLDMMSCRDWAWCSWFAQPSMSGFVLNNLENLQSSTRIAGLSFMP